MNKQEALEALLEVCRKQEQPGREVARVPHEQALVDLLEAARNLDVIVAMPPSARRDAKLRQHLRVIGGLALYALVDEVEVVEGKALDAWLNEGGAGRKEPVAINGRMGPVINYTAPPAVPPRVLVVGPDGRLRGHLA